MGRWVLKKLVAWKLSGSTTWGAASMCCVFNVKVVPLVVRDKNLGRGRGRGRGMAWEAATLWTAGGACLGR